MRHALLSLVLLSVAAEARAVTPDVRISQYGHTAWRTQDGYFGGAPYAIAQTADGYLWIGTSNGILRFDGIRFVPWTPPPGKQLPSPVIARLLAARDGSLWIGTTRGLSHSTKNEVTHYSSGASALYCPFSEDQKGAVWVLRRSASDHNGPVCQVDGHAMRCYGKADGIPEESYWSLARDPAGNVWLGGSTNLTRFRPGDVQSYYPDGLKGNEGRPGVNALAALPDGSLWVGFGGPGPGVGLQRLANGVWQPFVVPGFDSSTLSVVTLFIDRRDSLWVGTFGSGLYRIHGREVDHFAGSDGLAGDTVYALFEDAEGNLWVATDKGLDCFRDLKVTTFSTRQGLTNRSVGSVQAMRDGTTWLGGASGLDIFGSGIGSMRSFQPGKGLPDTQVTSLFEDHAGQHWVGINDTLNIYEKGGFTKINRRDGSPTGMIVGITEATDNSLWVSSFGPPRRLLHIVDRKVQEELPSPQTPGTSSLVADPRGGIWLGLVNGDLARYRDGRLESFRFEHTPDSRVVQVIVASDGAVLGATAFGLIGWSNGTQRILNARNGLPCDGVNGVVEDGGGSLWLYMQCGLVNLPRSDVQRWWARQDVRVQPRVLDAFDGVQTGNPTAFESKAVRAVDGRLWFTNASVAQTFDPAHLARNPVAPPVHVEQLIADHRNLPVEGDVRLPARTRDVEIDYTALSFAVPQKVGFRYRLEGRDRDWQEPGNRRQAFYTDLKPGAYRFHVIACNDDGVWNDNGASLSFSVAPAYYQTGWFRSACVGLFVAFLWGSYRLRRRQWERQFDMRMQERLTERARIARELHDSLLQNVQGLILKVHAGLKQIAPENPARQTLERALDYAEQTLVEGRDRVRDLRAAPANLGLPEAFQCVVNEAAPDGSSTFMTFVEGTALELHEIIREETYSIGREALINALNHSGAHSVELTITYDAREFRVRVRDDGRGIDPGVLKDGGRAGHWGLQGMRERADRIGAQLQVSSSPGAGTKVELRVPGKVAYRASPSRSTSA